MLYSMTRQRTEHSTYKLMGLGENFTAHTSFCIYGSIALSSRKSVLIMRVLFCVFRTMVCIRAESGERWIPR